MGQPNNITDIEFDIYDPTKMHMTIVGSGFYRGTYPGGSISRKISLGQDEASLDIFGSMQLSPEAWGRSGNFGSCIKLLQSIGGLHIF